MTAQAPTQDLSKYDAYFFDLEKLQEAEFIKWAYRDLSNIEGTTIGIKDISKEVEKIFKNKCSQRPYYLLIERTFYLATALTAAFLFTSIMLKFNFSIAKLLPKNSYVNCLSLSKYGVVAGLVSALFFAIREPQLNSIEAEVALECKKPDWKYRMQANAVKSWISSIKDARSQIEELRARCDQFHDQKRLTERVKRAASTADTDKPADLIVLDLVKQIVPELFKIQFIENEINIALSNANNQIKLFNRLSNLDKEVIMDYAGHPKTE